MAKKAETTPKTTPKKSAADTENIEAKKAAEQAEAAKQTGAPAEEVEQLEGDAAEAAEPAPDTSKSEEQAAGELEVPPASGSPLLKQATIPGEGTTIPIYVDGAMTRLPRGEKIEVTDAQIEAIRAAGYQVKGA